MEKQHNLEAENSVNVSEMDPPTETGTSDMNIAHQQNVSTQELKEILEKPSHMEKREELGEDDKGVEATPGR